MISRTKIAALCLVVIAAGVAAFGFYQFQENQKLNSAKYALETVEKALRTQDVKTFNIHVDTRAMAESILSQVLTEKPAQQAEENQDFWSSVKSMGSSLGNRLTDYLKPELINSLDSQINNFAVSGKFAQDIDLTNLYGRTPMLQKVWHDLAGKDFELRGISDIKETESNATANVNFYRKDLDFSSSLTLNMVKRSNVWVITGVDGLGQTLTQLETLRVKMLQARNLEIQNEINDSLRVENIEKSTGVSQSEFGGKRVLLRIAFVNTSTEDIQAFKARVTFKNKDGSELRTVTIKDTDAIPAGEVIEKSWPMTINPLSADDNFIFESDGENLIIETDIDKVEFVSGTILELTKI